MFKRASFGNSEGTYVSNEIKSKIIDYLYSKINLSQHRFIMLDTVHKLQKLKENEHYVAPNYKGYSYFLIMVTIDNRKYCVAINRKKLSYHKEQLDIKNVFMIQLQLYVNELFFNGTIFDGKLIQNNNESIFLVQDCFYLMGNNILQEEMFQKTTNLDNIFKLHFNKNNNYCKNFNFKLNKLYKYNDLQNLIFTILPSLQIPVNGITFFPPYSGINIVHIENKTEKIVINNKTEIITNTSYNIIHNFVDYLYSRTYSYELEGKQAQLFLTRTKIPDVYNISDDNNNNSKQSIAHIPSLKISHYCDNNINNTPVLFNCVYCTRFRKWIPISVV
jgi:hypothetical protein